MSIQTVDLKASKACRDWELLRNQLLADPSSFSSFPKGHRDAVIADTLCVALSRVFAFKRADDRYYFRCQVRREVISYLTMHTRYRAEFVPTGNGENVRLAFSSVADREAIDHLLRFDLTNGHDALLCRTLLSEKWDEAVKSFSEAF